MYYGKFDLTLLENYSYYYYRRQYVTLLIRRITLTSVLGDIKSLIYIIKWIKFRNRNGDYYSRKLSYSHK